MDLAELVRTTARSQSILVEGSDDLDVSSMTVVEFVLALEDALQIEIPNVEMTAANFKSVSTAVAMVTRLGAVT